MTQNMFLQYGIIDGVTTYLEDYSEAEGGTEMLTPLLHEGFNITIRQDFVGLESVTILTGPPADDLGSWEQVEELSFTAADTHFYLSTFDDVYRDPEWALPAPGSYRVRVATIGNWFGGPNQDPQQTDEDYARECDDWWDYLEASPTTRFALWIWPAPPTPPAVLRTLPAGREPGGNGVELQEILDAYPEIDFPFHEYGRPHPKWTP